MPTHPSVFSFAELASALAWLVPEDDGVGSYFFPTMGPPPMVGGALGIRLNGDISGLRFGLDGGGAFVSSGLGWLLQPAVTQAISGKTRLTVTTRPRMRFIRLLVIADPKGTETYLRCRYFRAGR